MSLSLGVATHGEIKRHEDRSSRSQGAGATGAVHVICDHAARETAVCCGFAVNAL
jgi:hypothetical protein